MAEHNLTANKLSLALRVPSTRIFEIINGRRSITADTAVRLARFFGTSAEFWLNLQIRYELEMANGERTKVNREVQPISFLKLGPPKRLKETSRK